MGSFGWSLGKAFLLHIMISYSSETGKGEERLRNHLGGIIHSIPPRFLWEKKYSALRGQKLLVLGALSLKGHRIEWGTHRKSPHRENHHLIVNALSGGYFTSETVLNVLADASSLSQKRKKGGGKERGRSEELKRLKEDGCHIWRLSSWGIPMEQWDWLQENLPTSADCHSNLRSRT